jgi:hypothetical protein
MASVPIIPAPPEGVGEGLALAHTQGWRRRPACHHQDGLEHLVVIAHEIGQSSPSIRQRHLAPILHRLDRPICRISDDFHRPASNNRADHVFHMIRRQG